MSSNVCAEEEPLWIYKVSFYYYAFMGTMAVIIIALPISWLTKDSEKVPTNPDLYSPLVHRFLPNEDKPVEYSTIEKALHIITTTGLEKEREAMESVLNNQRSS